MIPEMVEFRGRVNRRIANGHITLPVVDTEGSHPVVFALEDEPLFKLLARLRAIGGYANVFVSCRGGIRQLAVLDSRSAIAIPDDDMTDERPGPLASVGMFLGYLALRPNGVVLPVVNPLSPAVARDLALA